jgi:hypothetical protein
MEYLRNLESLRDDMRAKGWQITSFPFKYKDYFYIVLTHLYKDQETKPRCALVKLEFLREENIRDALPVPANSYSLIIEDMRVFREYFHIDYSKTLGDVLRQFTKNLGLQIPDKVRENPSGLEKEAMVSSLSFSDSEDPEKKYCFKVRRNPLKTNGEWGQRSVYNDNKTRILRATLYEKLGGDTGLSFCYSPKKRDERTDEEILKNWTTNLNDSK